MSKYLHPCFDGHDWWPIDGRPHGVKMVLGTRRIPGVKSYMVPVSVANTWRCRSCDLRRRGAMGGGPVDIVFAGDGSDADRAEALSVFRAHLRDVRR